MEVTSKLLVSSALLLAVCLKRRRRRQRNRHIWIREWIQNRQALGAFHQLMNELQLLDPSSYRNFLRIDSATFQNLLCMVAPMITHQDTVMRAAITPGERLALTLRFLATGEYTLGYYMLSCCIIVGFLF